MSFIRGRLRRLEEQGRRGVCPECGLPPDGPGYIVLIDEEAPEKSFQGDPNERCESCGRHKYTMIHLVYDEPLDEQGGGGMRWPPDVAG